jgi:hypothetical protein
LRNWFKHASEVEGNTGSNPMNNSRARHKNSSHKPGFGAVGIEMMDEPLNSETDLESGVRNIDSKLPVQPVSERFPALEKQEIVLTFFAPEAGEVTVAGTFNGWRADDRRLKNMGDGKWVARLLLRSGQYEYRFVVDGRWCEDPEAAQRVGNPYGSFNSVLLVPLETRTDLL